MANGKRARDVCVSDEELDSEDGASETSGMEASTEAALPTKRQQMDSIQAVQSSSSYVIKCTLPPHLDLTFGSPEAYEVHYRQHHLNRCSDCHKNFPSEHYLQLHITEHHDPIAAVRKERGERTFGCLVEDCERKCSTAEKRRLHLIDKHGFPKFYDFFIVNDGIDRRSTMLRQRRQGQRKRSEQPGYSQANKGGDLTSMDVDADRVTSLTTSMSALKFVPRNVKFGKGASKTFTR